MDALVASAQPPQPVTESNSPNSHNSPEPPANPPPAPSVATYTRFTFVLNNARRVTYQTDGPITLAMATIAGRRRHADFAFAEVAL